MKTIFIHYRYTNSSLGLGVFIEYHAQLESEPTHFGKILRSFITPALVESNHDFT
jgi:hypothetical protein